MHMIMRSVSIFERSILIVAVTLSVAITCTQVVSRFLFGVSTPWSEELIRYSIVWMCFLGAGPGFREGAHIAIDVLLERLSPRMQLALTRTVGAIVALFGALVLMSGFKLAQRALNFGQVSSAMELPMWIVYLPIPIGGALLFLHGSSFALNFIPSAVSQTSAAERISI